MNVNTEEVLKPDRKFNKLMYKLPLHLQKNFQKYYNKDLIFYKFIYSYIHSNKKNVTNFLLECIFCLIKSNKRMEWWKK